MKKTLILLPNDVMGGAEQYLFEICNFLSQKTTVDVVFFKKPISNFWNKNIDSRNINLIFLNASTEKKGLLIFLIWICKNRKYKYIFTSHVHTNSIIGFLRKMKIINAKRHIGRESTFIFDRFSGVKLFSFNLLYTLGYSKIDLLITQSDVMKKHLQVNLSKKKLPEKIITIPNLINLENILVKSNEFIPSNKDFIISAGRLIPEKGFDILIKSFGKIQNKIGNTNLIILGEGNERKKLTELIKDLKLENRIKLLGFINNPMPYFKNAKLCVVSSRIEGFPNVLLQMMALNGNVISTLCAGGIEDLNGILTCNTCNENELSNIMLETIKQPLNNFDTYKINLEKRSINNYWKKIKANLLNN